MARINISLPDELYSQTLKWRRGLNFSEICARAIRQELEAAENHRSAPNLLSGRQPAGSLEAMLAERFGLAEVSIAESPSNPSELRETLGRLAAAYLDQRLCDDSRLAIAGGRQTWCLVRNLSPRQVRVIITALGICQNDPRVLNAHANTLTTLLWLLYSPRSEAHLVGAEALDKIWQPDLPPVDYPSYFIMGSCSPFKATSPFAELLGEEAAQRLLGRGVCGDFLYNFFDTNGDLVSHASEQHNSILSAELLRMLCRREDARVILVAGGADKLPTIRIVLEAKLCNVLITDLETAEQLLE